MKDSHKEKYCKLLYEQFKDIDTKGYKEFNQQFELIDQEQKKLTNEELVDINNNSDLSEWHKFWSSRDLYIRTKDKKYIEDISRLEKDGKYKTTRMEALKVVLSLKMANLNRSK